MPRSGRFLTGSRFAHCPRRARAGVYRLFREEPSVPFSAPQYQIPRTVTDRLYAIDFRRCTCMFVVHMREKLKRLREMSYTEVAHRLREQCRKEIDRIRFKSGVREPDIDHPAEPEIVVDYADFIRRYSKGSESFNLSMTGFRNGWTVQFRKRNACGSIASTFLGTPPCRSAMRSTGIAIPFQDSNGRTSIGRTTTS